ncbi:hypothetical protein QOT17_016867 [Balamuthia mandrillaris]
MSAQLRKQRKTSASASSSSTAMEVSPWAECFGNAPKANFCPDCSCLLPLTSHTHVQCPLCKYQVSTRELDSQVRISKSKPKTAVRDKKKEESAGPIRATVRWPPQLCLLSHLTVQSNLLCYSIQD